MLQYPREIAFNPKFEIQRLRNSLIADINQSDKTPRINIHQCEQSFSDFQSQIAGVDIRKCDDLNDSLRLTTVGGQLRSAYSQVEGLDAYAQKESQDGSSREFDRSKDTISTNDRLANGHAIGTSSAEISSRLGVTTFEQAKSMFMKKHQIKAEIKSGKRVGFYRFILDIGRGNFSKVKLANHSLLNTSVAVKVIDRTKFNAKTRCLLAQEVTNMERLNHPHIIRIFEVHEVVQRCCVMMEYAPAGELHTYLRRNGKMEDRNAKIISAQIVSALRHMHDNGVVHRDLKAENVLFFTANFVKVGDFGFSKAVTPSDALTTYCGSPSYAAPELFIGESYIGPAVDLWALGVLIFYMVVGSLPFRGESIQTIKNAVINENYIIPTFVHAECKSLIDGLICKSVPRRLRIEQVQRAAWFKDQNWLEHSSAPHPNENQVSHSTARGLLANWWNVQDWELDAALASGPRNPLTGIYRILLVYGKKFENGRGPFGIDDKKLKKKMRQIENGFSYSSKKKKVKNAPIQQEELTTVDLRESFTQSDSSSQKRTRTCTIS